MREGQSPFVAYQPQAVGEDKPANQKHVEQIYGYLTLNGAGLHATDVIMPFHMLYPSLNMMILSNVVGLKYGVLCSDEDYYFLKSEEGILYASDAIKVAGGHMGRARFHFETMTFEPYMSTDPSRV